MRNICTAGNDNAINLVSINVTETNFYALNAL